MLPLPNCYGATRRTMIGTTFDGADGAAGSAAVSADGADGAAATGGEDSKACNRARNCSFSAFN
jgi:hypothetical protein